MNQNDRSARIQHGLDIMSQYRQARARIQQRLDEMDTRVESWLAAYDSEAAQTGDMVRLEAMQVDLAKLLTAFREIENMLLAEFVNVNEILRTR